MSEIKYPKALTASDWDKHKGLLAKSKPTGIGDALKKLQKQHEAIDWEKLDGSRCTGISDVDNSSKTMADYYKQAIAPLIPEARKVQELADGWAAKFSKDKLIPKSAAEAATAVARAADTYYNQLRIYDAVWQAGLKARRKELIEALRKAVKPMMSSGLNKIDLFLKDIATLKAAPTKANLIKLATGDGGARGYCTALKNWDQYLKEFPDLREPVFKGNAITTFMPAVKDYGANINANKWEEMLAGEAASSKRSVDAVVLERANKLAAEAAEVRKFRGYVESVIKTLG